MIEVLPTLILVGVLLLICPVLIVAIAWTHHPRGIIRHYKRRKEGGSYGKNR